MNTLKYQSTNTPKSIFLIDDDIIFTFLTTKMMSKNPLVGEINVFGNGLDVYNFIKANTANTELLPDIILLDLNMPIMDGWQFLEHYAMLLPKINKKIEIYILSSSIFIKDVAKAKDVIIVSDYLIKPLKMNQLKVILDN
ncbi:MAG: response regulator [Saprospiraceae bacterium]|nr:response regulator [Saprospiraceae bacterium]